MKKTNDFNLLEGILEEVKSTPKLRLTPQEWGESRSAWRYIPDLMDQVEERLEELEGHISSGELSAALISILNWIEAKEKESERKADLEYQDMSYLNIFEGDIVMVEQGLCFGSETGYQHPALVVARNESSLFIVPMSSDQRWYECGRNFPGGWNYQEGDGSMPNILSVWFACLEGTSALFLNSARWIDASRVLYRKGMVKPSSEMDIFNWIKEEAKKFTFSDDEEGKENNTDAEE